MPQQPGQCRAQTTPRTTHSHSQPLGSSYQYIIDCSMLILPLHCNITRQTQDGNAAVIVVLSGCGSDDSVGRDLNAGCYQQRRSFCFDWSERWALGVDTSQCRALITCCGLASLTLNTMIRLSGSENKQTLFPCSSIGQAAWPGKVRDSVPKISNHTSFLLKVFVWISASVSDMEMLLVPSFQCHVSSGLAALLRRRLDTSCHFADVERLSTGFFPDLMMTRLV